MNDFTLTIDGKAVAADESFGVINPSSGEVFARAPECSQAQLDRLGELANIGAGHAAAAFARLAERLICIEVPRFSRSADIASLSEPSSETGEGWSTGVFFEFEGAVDALVGILFRASASETLVRRIVGVESGLLPTHYVESALMEVGNILASHVASAIADTLGRTLLPSIPTLAMEHADATLVSLAARRGGDHPVRIECELHDAERELEGLLVLVPRAADA